MFNVNLKNLRLKQDLSQKAVADYLNISPQSVSKWEKGEALPSVLFLPKLAECLSCEINDFFKQEESKYDLAVFKEYLRIYEDCVILKNKTVEDFARFLIRYPDVVNMVNKIGEEIKEHRMIKRKTVQSILGCSEDESVNFLESFVMQEWVECFEGEDYYVLKSNIDGSGILLNGLVDLGKVLK